MTRTPLLILGALSLPCLAVGSDSAIRGFSEVSSEARRALEEKILAAASAARVREHIREMSETPHHAGSPGGDRVAAYILERFREWGLAAEYHEFEGLMPTPRERRLEMLAPERYVAKLAEPALPEDKDSDDEGGLPTFNAYSPDGDVSGEAVYVNYGMPADYEKLAELGIDVKGKIVLARYMGGWRGIKPKVAAEHGAIGCVIYSDPRDDGFYRGDVYPKGPFRPEWGVQRGSTMDMPTYPGDPLTPGWGARPGARRLPIEEAETLPKIPVLPIAWGDALPILRALGGPVAPESWRGALPTTYHVGPGPAEVRLKLGFDWDVTRGRNVIARIEGSEFPDEWVIYGNHHDAWVNGATDPVSGAAALLETARVLGEMVRQGWRPKRTIVFAAWDAEEWGLLGSTEWGETLADELREKAVAYFNTDSNTQGVLSLGGSHSLERFLNDAARDVRDPRTGKSLWAVMREDALKDAAGEARDAILSRDDLRVAALGSGSDYTVFVDHLGIASTNTAFRGEGGGVYHSGYDSFDWYRRFGDPEFVYGKALAQFHAVALARMADAEVLPFEFRNLGETVAGYVAELERLAEAKNSNLRVIGGALERLTAAAKAYEERFQKVVPAGFDGDPTELNELLRKAEGALTHPEGLPKRKWYKHLLYAPGFYTGYGVKTVPGVREALEQNDPKLAEREAERFADALLRLGARLVEAEAMLAGL